MRQLYQDSSYINCFRNTNYSYIKKKSMEFITFFLIYDTIYMTIINFNILIQKIQFNMQLIDQKDIWK